MSVEQLAAYVESVRKRIELEVTDIMLKKQKMILKNIRIRQM
jgi:hypothetical protein